MRRTFVFCSVVFAARLAAQTETVVGGVIADSSVAAPVAVWNRSNAFGDTTTVSLSGWTIGAEATHRIAPRQRIVASIEVTPLHAHAGDRMYVDGERRRDLQFDDSSINASFGRIDLFGERWSSDVRAVVSYDRVADHDPFWSSPYLGIRARGAYRHITADDPLRLTFEGSEVAVTAEGYEGKHAWARFALDQRFSRRMGRFIAGERASVLTGRSLNRVSAFLAGGSWPAGDLRPLYGFRYAELRLDRAVTATGDLQFLLRDSLSVTGHVSALHANDLDAHGAAIDMTWSWRGIAFRAGVGVPHADGRSNEHPVFYASVLSATFVRAR